MLACTAMEPTWTQKGEAILADQKDIPHISARTLGIRHNSHHSTVTKYISEVELGVVGKHPGRRTSLNSSQVHFVTELAFTLKSASSVKIACSMKAQGASMSIQAANRCLRDNGIVCGYPKNVQLLPDLNKGRRMWWAS